MYIIPYSKPHPLSTEAAVASLERYLPDPRYRIQLSNLIHATVERVVEVTSGEDFAVQGGPAPDSESITKRVRKYEAACTTLMAMATIGGRWAEEEHYHVWRRALERLGSRESRNGSEYWIRLQRYPATLLLYALGLGALEAGRLQFLGHLFGATIHKEHEEDLPAVRILPPSCFFSQGGQVMQILEGMDQRYAPLNDWIHETLWPHVERILPDKSRYTLVFDKLELLLALGYAHKDDSPPDWYWAPPGSFGYRQDNQDQVFKEIEESLATMQDHSPFVTSGIFGATAEECNRGLTKLKDFIPKLRWW